MTDLELTLMEMTSRILALEARIDDLESNVGEQTSVDVVSVFPDSPYNNQIVLLNSGGPNGNGGLHRYEAATTSWIEL